MECSKSVSVSGYLLSSLLYEHTSSSSDQEGFLIGDVIIRETESISDNQISLKKEEMVINIYSYVPCEDVCSFYSFNGEIQKDKLQLYLKDKVQDLVGWYRFRRHSPLVMSVREKAVHKNLNASVQHGGNIVFGLFNASLFENFATHTFDHMFFFYNGPDSTISSGVFEPISLNVVNLEDTSLDEYRICPRAPVNTRSGSFSAIVTAAQGDEQLLESVLVVEDINNALLEKIEGLVEQVAGSEAEIGCIALDITELEEKIAKLTSSASKAE